MDADGFGISRCPYDEDMGPMLMSLGVEPTVGFDDFVAELGGIEFHVAKSSSGIEPIEIIGS
jgi:hypothetical protein